MAGVSAAAVTKAVKGPLLAAMDGKRIDAAHPVAVKYLVKQDRARTEPAATGLDPLYELAVQQCQASDKWSPSSLRAPLGIGLDRAKAIVAMMQAAGVVPNRESPARTTARPPAPASRSVSGNEAVRATKKSEALERFNEEPNTELREIPDDLARLADWTIRDVVHRWGTDVAFVDWLKAVKEIEMVAERRLKNAQARGELISRHVVKSGMIDTLDGAFTRMLTDGAKTIATREHSLVKTGATPQEIEDLVAKQLSTFIKPTKSKITRILRNA